MLSRQNVVIVCVLFVSVLVTAMQVPPAEFAPEPKTFNEKTITVDGEWIQLFNGKDIDDWIVKLNHHDLNDNYGDTFRVEDGILKVRYDQYEDFEKTVLEVV